MQTALVKLGSGSFRERLDIRTSFDTGGLPPAEAQKVAAAPKRITGQAEFAGRGRIKLIEHIPPTLPDLHIVLYDGASYASRDGSHFQRLGGAPAAALGNIASLSPQTTGRFLTGVRDLGADRTDGRQVEHYAGTVDPEGVKAIASRFYGPLGLDPGALRLTRSGVDIYLDKHTEQPVKIASDTDTRIDLARLRAGRPGALTRGILRQHQHTELHVDRVGARIVVIPPPLGAAPAGPLQG